MTESKSILSKIGEADLVKFQLLSAYVGLRVQDLEMLQKDLEILKLKLEQAEQKKLGALHEVRVYQSWIKEEYALSDSDEVNWADGTIKRIQSNEQSNRSSKSEES